MHPNNLINANKVDDEIDFNKLVVVQMNRCNLALSQGVYQFSTAVIAFRCMLSHLIQRDDKYKEDMSKIGNRHEQMQHSILNIKQRAKSEKRLEFETSIYEYQALVRLCARHDLFPSKRGELTDDDDD